MNRRLGLGLLLAFVAALALRAPHLDSRPMHNDEAVNALKLQALWEHGTYVYDPDEYHGPALHYASLPFLWLSPARDFSQFTERTLRLVTVCFGLALIPLLWWLRDGLGKRATFFAAVFTAISPAMVFYSRYFIHEMLLVCFSMLVMAAGWRYSRTRRIGWAVLAGAGVGLMYATKETCVIALGAMGLAMVLTWFWNRKPGDPPLRFDSFVRPKHALAALVIAALISVILFTSFFTNARGPLDSLLSFVPWFHRARGHSPHIHGFGFYFERLAWFHSGRGPVWSEGLVLVLACLGLVAAITRRALGEANVSFVRFVASYTVILALAYSTISYKTPWCLLGFLHGMILLAGVGAVALWHWIMPALAGQGEGAQHRVPSGSARIRTWIRALAVVLLLVAATAHLTWLAWQSCSLYAADRRNPYVYSQTVPDVLDMIERIEALAKIRPQNAMVVQVMAPESDYWPLPWYLRGFKQVGWWDHWREDPAASVLVVGQKLASSLEKSSDSAWTALGIYGLRPGSFFQLYVRSDLWRDYLATMPRHASEKR